jgi:hypothetical protein
MNLLASHLCTKPVTINTITVDKIKLLMINNAFCEMIVKKTIVPTTNGVKNNSICLWNQLADHSTHLNGMILVNKQNANKHNPITLPGIGIRKKCSSPHPIP